MTLDDRCSRSGASVPASAAQVSWRTWVGRLCLMLGSTVISLLTAEVVLRLSTADRAIQLGIQPDEIDCRFLEPRITPDDLLGFGPNLNSSFYSRFGTAPNDYPIEKQKGRERILFVGDSVTARGELVNAIRKQYGDEKYEYWNAGVEGYTTKQELIHYKLYSAAIHPDRVVLVFHLNDFQMTPVFFCDPDGKFILCAPGRPAWRINRFLFLHSELYRLYLGVRLRAPPFAKASQEVEDSLRGFRDLVKPANLTVLVFTYIQWEEDWTASQKREYQEIKRILTELDIRFFDLKPWTDAGLQDGEIVRQPDAWHPNESYSRYIASRLKAAKLLPAGP